jgi:hypothetical protein
MTHDIDTIREAMQCMHRKACDNSERNYMSIPADPKRDADLILSAAIDELEQLRGVPAAYERGWNKETHTLKGLLEEARAERDEMAKLAKDATARVDDALALIPSPAHVVILRSDYERLIAALPATRLSVVKEPK